MSPPPADLSSSCFYGVLGVDKSATDAEVTKAYRKLVLKVHPDKRPDDREKAEEEFKILQQAYDVLRDSEKRKLYDQFGKAAFEQGAGGGEPTSRPGGGATFQAGGMGGEDLEAMFRQMFGGAAGAGPGGAFVFRSAGPAGAAGGFDGFNGAGDLGGLFGGLGGFPGAGFAGAMPGAMPGRGATAAAPPHAIPSGTHVVVQGLTKAPEHNGKTGRVVGWDQRSGRYQVAMDGQQMLSLRPESLVQRCRVEVAGLATKPELNGRAGEIYGYDEGKSRYLVLLDAPEAQVLSLQPATCVLPQGTRVVLQGLSTERFNGRMAHIVSVHRDASRYTVQCDDRSQVRVKFENVRC